MARKSRRRGKRTFSIAGTAVAVNAIAQMVEPFITSGVVDAARSGDPAAMISALKAGTKSAVTVANILQAAGPAIILALAKKIARGAGAPNPRFGGFRAY